MAMPEVDLTALTPTELHDFQRQLSAEFQRRDTQPFIEAGELKVVDALISSGAATGAEAATPSTPSADIPAWSNPGTDHTKMYRPGDIIKHSGKTWRSTHPFLNHWEPGTTGVDYRIWAEVDEAPVDPVDPGDGGGDTPPAPTTTPWKAGLAVKVDELYTYNGTTYKVVQAHTTQAGWEPTNLPALWKAV